MRNQIGMAAVAGMACLALAACGGDKEPTGQVVATIGKQEVTATDLKNEMGNFAAPNAQIRKQAEQAALQQIINRKLAAEAARKEGLEKSPEYAQQKARLEEGLLAQLLQNEIVKQVPPPSKDEVDRYVAENSDIYAQRKVFEVDQIRMAMTNDQALLRQLQAIQTLEEIKAFLDSRNIRNQQAPAEFDALNLPPQFVKQIIALPPNEVFIVPAGNLLVISRLRNTRVEPVTGEAAARHATQVIKAARTQEALQRRFAGIVQAGAKDVKYSKAYEPPKPPAKAAAPAPAPAKK